MKFNFNNKNFEYLIHNYGQTWRNERKVEIPLGLRALQLLKEEKNKLVEVGAVLPYYLEKPPSWRVIDWYDDGPYSENINFFEEEYTSCNCISISTIEHFGRVEHNHDDLIGDSYPPKGLQKIINECNKFFVTWGTGFNSELDDYVLSNPKVRKYCSVLKINKDGHWIESNDDKDFKIPYAHNAGTALAIIVCKNFEL